MSVVVPVVELVRVTRLFDSEPPVRAMDAVDFTVLPGEYVAIVGPSGSGKSTLLNMVGLLDRPNAGRYRLDGIDTATLSEGQRAAARADRIGFVFQSFHLLAHRTVFENVMIGCMYQGTRRRERRARATAALGQVAMLHRANFVPTRLSGGERQRVAVARALAAEPSLLLCDEPTGNLDSANTASLLDLLDTLCDRGLTIVVITHDHEVARRARRRVRIVDGRLSEEP